MPYTNQIMMPRVFPKRVHRALRVWYKQHSEDTLSDLLLCHEMRMQKPDAPHNLLSNHILMEGLDHLRSRDADAADLLERRFLNTETAREIAYSFNVTADVISQRQRTAIEQLARVIWEKELVLRQRQEDRIEARLAAPTYTRLFGVDENLSILREKLQGGEEPWIVAVEGMGGIGKTALVDALVRRMAVDTHFRDIAWITVHQRLFRLTGRIETSDERPSLNPAGLVERLIEQFGLDSLRRGNSTEKLYGIKRYLRDRRSLIVIDNLETIIDYHALLPRLKELTNPSACLLTTRYSLQGEGGVYIFPLQPLSQESTFTLIRHEARNQGLNGLAQASDRVLGDIYTVTGGNPLATKLIIGKLHAFSLPVVLKRLSEVQGASVQGLFDFLFADAWEILTPIARRLMQALLLMPNSGGTLGQLAAATDVNPTEAVSDLRLLVQYSLVDVKGDFTEKRYILHQLARTFVEQIVASA